MLFRSYGVQIGYTIQYKIREGSSLKECILAAWVSKPEQRNPAIVVHKLAVEVSGCTYNARRRRLARILGSTTMRNYLRGISFSWSDSTIEDQYFEALNTRDIHTFEKLYWQNSSLRPVLGEAIAESLSALLKTGVDSNNCLSTMWVQGSREPLAATFPYRDQHWAGLLSDTIDSCTVAIMTPYCLVFKDVRGTSTCQYPCDGNP